jgi:hypothetical protein
MARRYSIGFDFVRNALHKQLNRPGSLRTSGDSYGHRGTGIPLVGFENHPPTPLLRRTRPRSRLSSDRLGLRRLRHQRTHYPTLHYHSSGHHPVTVGPKKSPGPCRALLKAENDLKFNDFFAAPAAQSQTASHEQNAVAGLFRAGGRKTCLRPDTPIEGLRRVSPTCAAPPWRLCET